MSNRLDAVSFEPVIKAVKIHILDSRDYQFIYKLGDPRQAAKIKAEISMDTNYEYGNAQFLGQYLTSARRDMMFRFTQ